MSFCESEDSPRKKRPGRKKGSKSKKGVPRAKSSSRKLLSKESHNKRENKDDNEIYGILDTKNIGQVQFGLDKLFPTWYGSTVYFDKDTKKLGVDSTEAISVPSAPNTNTNVSRVTRSNDNNTIWLDTLYVCEYCFKYTSDPKKLQLHDSLCPYKLRRTPPGKIKYRSPQYTIRRVKGYKEKLFCQCLCLFTKLFLDNKSIYFKVENYDFFILYKTEGPNKPMAFFSKDVVSFNENNLACILTFPPYQRKKLGTLLIEFSYKLSRSQGIISGPELPLSPFGLIGYITYWARTICWHILSGDLNHLIAVSIDDISLVTGFRITDIIMTLDYLECINQEDNTININEMKRWLNSRIGTDNNNNNANNSDTQFMIQDEYLMIQD